MSRNDHDAPRRGRPPTGARRGDARPTRGPRPQDARAAEEARRASEIARATGLPPEHALRVARGQADANDLVRRMALEAEAENLVRRHGLVRSLAMQVALGHADLQQVLRRMRIEAHLAAHADETALVPGAELVIGLTGQRALRARVVEVDRYEVDLLDLDAGAPLRAHKLQLKYAGAPDALRRVRRAMAWDASRKGRVAEIAARPQERYGCSDRRLGELVDARTPVRVTLVEGEVLQGEIVRVCRYEFVLATKQGEVTIFRHALADLR